MNKQDLIDAARDHLRLSIACTLDIDVEAYRSSLHAQNEVNKCLTNVMSLGANDELVDALKEILELRYIGGSPTSEEFDDLVLHLRACRNTFHKEIEAYRCLYKSFEKGQSPEVILQEIKAITPLQPDYQSD
jgi:hypothetical protein